MGTLPSITNWGPRQSLKVEEGGRKEPKSYFCEVWKITAVANFKDRSYHNRKIPGQSVWVALENLQEASKQDFL